MIRESHETEKLKRSKERMAFLFISPALIILALTSVFPAFYSIVMSFFNWNWGKRMDFVGLENYINYLTDLTFWKILGQTLYFTVGAVILEFIIGFALALIINRIKFGLGIFRTLLLLPLMVSGIIVSMIWKVMLDPTLGIVNYLMSQVGLPKLVWFGSKATAMPSIILIDIWWQTAFIFIVLSAGLRSLPLEPFEAAEVDGANAFQKFFFLTLPMLKPVIMVVLIFRTIDCLRVFALIFGTTGGGPVQVTESIETFAYRTAFRFREMSQAMTLSVIFSIIIIVICLIYLKIGKSESASE